LAKVLFAIALAIAATTALDATGHSLLSALPLIPLFALFGRLDRMSLRELGLTAGTMNYYGLALAHPLLVMTIIVVAARLSGALDPATFSAVKAAENVALVAGVTFFMAIITEEGFFRGWLWAALSRKRVTPLVSLLATTAAFVAWHISFVFLSSEFHFAPAQIPMFFVNATLLGLIWGLLRLGSGSILVSSAGHGLWNGLTYVLFGVGSGTGALHIMDVGLYGPEVGLLGAALNAAFAALLFLLLRNRLSSASKFVAVPT
jgi:membrane protease YdiL (CAAX protease family)